MPDYPNIGGRANHPPEVFVVGGNTTGASSRTTFRGASLSFSAAGQVSAGFSNGSMVFSATQSNQTIGLYATSNTEGASSSSTFNATSLLFQGKGAASVGFSNGSIVIDAPSAAAGNVTFSAGANSSGLGSVIFSNSNGVSFGLGAGSVITASAAGGGGIGGGVSTGGNTAGSTGTVTTGNIIFVGSNAISLSQSTGAAGSAATITINSPATSSLVGTNGVSLSSNGSTITISGWTLPHFEPFPMLLSGSTTYAPAIGSIFLQPFVLPALISGGRINRMTAFGSTASIMRDSSANFASNTTGSRALRFQYSNVIGLYSLGAGTNSTRLESVWSSMHSLELSHTVSVASGAGVTMSASVRGTITYIASIDSAGAATTSSYSNSGSSSSASTAMATSALTSVLSSIRNMLSSQILLPVPLNTTITPGLYWLAEFWTTASSTTNTSGDALSVVNRVGQAGFTSGTAYRNWAATVATSGSNIFPGQGGVFSGTSASLPATIAFSDIRTQALMPLQYFNYVNSTI